MCCGHTLEHSPQSVQRPATWNALMIWNIFSSKVFAAALFSTPDAGLSNTHFSQVHAGHTSRQALQRMQRESSPCQKAKRSSGVIFSSFSTSSKRPLSSTSPSLAEQLVVCNVLFGLAVEAAVGQESVSLDFNGAVIKCFDLYRVSVSP